MPSSLRLSARYISVAHTICASTAFLSALLIGLRLHYRKIVKNDVAGYPDEWWPSVSATIGDWYPERSIFQILIALTAGPRFLLVVFWWLIIRSDTSVLPSLIALSGILRTFSCGGWVYITSTDDHDSHDVLMILYMVLNIPWMIGSIIYTPRENMIGLRKRKLAASSFFLAIIPLVYYFIQHKQHRIPGAYTKYSFFEWSLIMSDIWFDSITKTDFTTLQITVKGPSDQITVEYLSPSSPSNVPGSKHISPVLSKPMATQNQYKSPPRFTINEIAYRISYKLFYFSLPGFAPLRSIAAFVSDLYLSYIWWSVFTVLAPSLFYFSVWKLSVSGQEISLASMLLPFLLGTDFSYLDNHRGKTTLHLIIVLSLVAYAFNSPLIRLVIVSLGNVAGSILKALEWRNSVHFRNGIVLILGLVLSSLSKLMNHTVNPVWSIANAKSGGWNKTGILLGLFAVWNFATRNVESDSGSRNYPKRTEKKERQLPGAWILPSIGLGGWLFSLECFLSDADTMIAYSWTGYPIKGPLPGGLHACLTIIAMAFGVLISISRPSIVENPLWIVIGSISAYIMCRERNWTGYCGGLAIAVFLCSLSPVIIENVSKHGKNMPSKVYGTAWLTYCLLVLANVWTVAYAFVPAGWLLRERTDIVIGMQIFTVSLGIIPSWINWSVMQSQPLTPQFRSRVRSSLTLFTLAAVVATALRLPVQVPRPYNPGDRLITAGIWTVHFGIDDEGRDSQYRMRDLISDMKLDVVGLLETDLHRIVFGNRDLTRIIAEDLGYHVDIGPGPNEHTWGAVLLSKFPILQSTHHLLPSPHGELAPAISAVLDVWGQNVTVVVAHNGQEEDPLDRELQSTELARIMASSFPDPVIFLGYVVTLPHEKRPNPYEILISDGLVHDIEDEDTDRWCEYILYRGLYRIAFARVSRSTITDTELQIGKFVLPKKGHPVVNASRDERYIRVYREVFPSTMWFPDEFLQNVNPEGVRGHYYHVNPWPLYYKLPDDAVV